MASRQRNNPFPVGVLYVRAAWVEGELLPICLGLRLLLLLLLLNDRRMR
jgi:hypothetical protein